MTDLTDRLDEIEARADAATEGPWRASILHGVTYEDGSSSHVAGIYPGSTSGPPPVFVTNSIDRRDAEFITHARTDVPALADALRAVLDLHRDAGPSQGYGANFKGGYGEFAHCCATCGAHGEYGVEWPCPTVRAIAKTLGAGDE